MIVYLEYRQLCVHAADREFVRGRGRGRGRGSPPTHTATQTSSTPIKNSYMKLWICLFLVGLNFRMQTCRHPKVLERCCVRTPIISKGSHWKLYYSAKFEDICIYCAASAPPSSDIKPHYPQCLNCEDKLQIPNAKYQLLSPSISVCTIMTLCS
jgi:hypothetical protein